MQKTNTKVGDYGVLVGSFPSINLDVPTIEKSQTAKPQKSSVGKIRKGDKTGKKSKTKKTENLIVVKSYKLPTDLISLVESVAYWQRRKIQDVVAEAFRVFLATIPEDDRRPIPKPKTTEQEGR